MTPRQPAPDDRRWSAITTASILTCPKCHGAMRTYERSGVTVDQCADCRGLFLDRWAAPISQPGRRRGPAG